MLRVLVVDDDDVQRADIVGAVREAGMEAAEAEGEQMAFAMMEEGSYALAVVDIMLSKAYDAGEGLDVIRGLREQQPSCCVIALTTRRGNDIGVEALRAGADDFIATGWKYINWRQLLQQRLALWRGVAEKRASRSREADEMLL